MVTRNSANARLVIERLQVHRLNPISLTVAAGECVSLSGPSGVGKSMFLRAIADLVPHGGTVWLDGVECSRMPAAQWRRRVGLIPADTSWWYETVGEHLVGVADADLSALDFSQEILHAPVGRLSSGESKRLALLRQLRLRPEVLLLDEPTANLDPVNTARVESLIQKKVAEWEMSVIWVSHDPVQLSRIAQRHFRLDRSGIADYAV